MNRLTKLRKATSISTFDLFTKLPLNKLLMVHNSVIDFCFDSGENKHITVNSYGARWVKNIKDYIMCLNNQ